ncbi:MAG: CopG family antitoxin [Candidatus Binataceae bacterium]
MAQGRRTTLARLEPSPQTISLRLPKPMLERLKARAKKNAACFTNPC